MPDPSTAEQIRSQVERLKQSGALGRSPAYPRLLDYLAEATINGAVSSEMDVAFEVFNKDEHFDVATDSSVRVYIYKLRRKLDSYYSGPGSQDDIRLIIPKGEYRVAVEQISPAPEADGPDSSRPNPLASSRTIAVLLLGIALGAVLALGAKMAFQQDSQRAFSDGQIAFWAGILDDDKPVMIVIGDYYIFGEVTREGETRLVREFNINSASDLRAYLEQQEQRSGEEDSRDYFDLALTYLPRGSAYALANVHQVVQQAGKTPRLAMMSELSAKDLRANHIIYLGYISGMGVLEQYTFARSSFKRGNNYDELVNTVSGTRYVSDVVDTENAASFVDYGLLASFSLTEKLRVIVLAGTRDAGLMEASEIAMAPNLLARMQLESSSEAGYFSVLEVSGFNLTNISGKLVSSEYLRE